MRKSILLLIAVLVVAAVIGASFSISGNLTAMEQGTEIPQLSLDGFSRARIDVVPEGLAILLTSGCRQLSMVATQEQIASIAMGAENKMGIRPLAHDLIETMAEEFGIDVLMVKVESLKDGAYYAKLLLKQGNKILNMDSRPSDAIAVAVRTGSPVYVNDGLLEDYGNNIC